MSTEHFADWDGTIRHRAVPSTCSHCSRPRRRGFATCSEHADATKSSTAKPASFEDDNEPDWESIIADRLADSFDEDAAQDRYDNSVYGP